MSDDKTVDVSTKIMVEHCEGFVECISKECDIDISEVDDETCSVLRTAYAAGASYLAKLLIGHEVYEGLLEPISKSILVMSFLQDENDDEDDWD